MNTAIIALTFQYVNSTYNVRATLDAEILDSHRTGLLQEQSTAKGRDKEQTISATVGHNRIVSAALRLADGFQEPAGCYNVGMFVSMLEDAGFYVMQTLDTKGRTNGIHAVSERIPDTFISTL